MGKKLIIKGADFSINGIVPQYQVVDGYLAQSSTGDCIRIGIPYEEGCSYEVKAKVLSAPRDSFPITSFGSSAVSAIDLAYGSCVLLRAASNISVMCSGLRNRTMLPTMQLPCEFVVSADSKNYTATYNGDTTVSLDYGTKDTRAVNYFYLFTSSGYAVAGTYGIKSVIIKNANGVVTHELLAAQDNRGKYCFLDVVTGELHYASNDLVMVG